MARRDSLLRRSFALRSDDLGRRVVGGAGYQFLGIGLRTLLTLGSTAILARLLSPSDFGYVAMATVVTEFAGLLSPSSPACWARSASPTS
ncbi:oligosaccharide flippase family protein [Rubrivivax benzoatilyticus]|uniref:oligosaccharide flippase family protein n=1 Tax=Rubrivivax benzoatilyticus TaxID=316997 RepID=UPI00040DA402|nr:oligosaccharide flippase family protein [Rubrivivax benzoatilyticus]